MPYLNYTVQKNSRNSSQIFRDLTIFASWNDGKLRIFKVDFRLMEAHMSENSGEIFISVECRLFVIQHVCVQL